ncbi:hypothetical protein [Brucella tritici]|uniref:hypothetical protein n=1 Tax=Brucella tritici TaxID=94626 RepID=UPI0020010649|nr:hypothetical protein [Brucella tritici]
MTTRMIIGQNSGEMLFRIVAPGYDATDRTQPAVFDSRNDYLKIHAIADLTLTRWSSGGLYYYQGEYHFPDLGYVPFVFPSITPTTLGRVFYPNDSNAETAEMNDFFDICVSSSGIWVSVSDGVTTNYNYRFRALIFKNPLNRTTT